MGPAVIVRRFPPALLKHPHGQPARNRPMAALSSVTFASPRPSRTASVTQCRTWSSSRLTATLSRAALTALTWVRMSMQYRSSSTMRCMPRTCPPSRFSRSWIRFLLWMYPGIVGAVPVDLSCGKGHLLNGCNTDGGSSVKPGKSERIGYDSHARGRHRPGGQHRVDGADDRQWNHDDVIGKGPDEVLADDGVGPPGNIPGISGPTPSSARTSSGP